jgi:hypothetical protein
MELCKNSIVYADGGAEYYLGDLPGRLQYKKTVHELTTIPNIGTLDSDCGFVQIPVSPTLSKRFVPNTKTGRAGDWELLVVFKSERDEGKEIWMKGALRNKKDGRIALMTCTDKEATILKYKNRAIPSMERGWFVGHYRMGAPMVFWRAVAAAVAE